MDNQNIPFTLFPNCIKVRGHARSIIVDLHRNRYKFIPNILFEILDVYCGSSIFDVKCNYDQEHHETIDDYFKYLTDNQFVCFAEVLPEFQKLSVEWHEPSTISNATLDIVDEIPFTVLNELSDSNCNTLVLRLKREVDAVFFYRIIEIVDALRICELRIIMPFSVFCENVVAEIFNVSVKLKRLVVLNSPEKKQEYYGVNKSHSITYIDSVTTTGVECGKVSPLSFAPTRQHVLESIKFNTCLYKKVYVDSNGNVKNCPFSDRIFGNVREECLNSIVAKSEFRELWSITKDLVDVCSDCEFRYICMDCRVFTETQEVRNAKPKYCNYNPYIAKWAGQDGFVSVDYWRQNNCNQTN